MTNDHAASAVTGGMFEAIDSKDATAFVGYLTEDAVFCFGSASPATGRAAIQVAVDGFFGTIAGCTHRIHRTIRDGATVVCEGEVTYRRINDTEVTLPFTDVLEYSGELISHYKIYIDISPLYAD